MDKHDKLQLKDREAIPTNKILKETLGSSYIAYEVFQEALPNFDIEQDWQWYTPHKAWFAKGQYFWTTPRGTRKEKNLYWLHVYEGFFCVAVWFKEKNRNELLSTDVSEQTKQIIRDAKTMGKLPTFPVVFNITTAKSFSDIYTLLDYKKKMEL